jgi:hypothetical protein
MSVGKGGDGDHMSKDEVINIEEHLKNEESQDKSVTQPDS